MNTIEEAKWLLSILFVPTLMLGMAMVFYFRRPKKINLWYGYRTSFSMKNQDTWTVANQLSTTWLLYTFLLFFGVSVLILVWLGKEGITCWFGSIKMFFLMVTVFSSVLIFVPIIRTEYKLRQIFNRDGTRK